LGFGAAVFVLEFKGNRAEKAIKVPSVLNE